jgi:hypothetical protein
MTLPSSPSNESGGFYAGNATPVNLTFLGMIPNPPATGSIAVAQSPSGSVTNESASSNYLTGETSTQEYLADVLVVDSPQQGSPAVNAPCSFNSLNPASFQTYRWE